MAACRSKEKARVFASVIVLVTGVPSAPLAPITSEVERQLKQLVAQFGEKQVLDALGPLITKCKWNDSQCVANASRRIARKIGG